MLKQLVRNQNITQGTTLVVTLVIANFLNFVLSAVLGRVLTLEEFGIFTLFSTLAYFVSIFINSLAGIVNYQVAHSFGQGKHRESVDLLFKIRKSVLPVAVVISVVWILASPAFSIFFKVNNILYFLLFSPVFSLGLIAAAYRGYLQGNFKFGSIGALSMIESGSKVAAGLVLIYFNLKDWIYIVIPISFLAVLFFAWFLSRKRVAADLASPVESSVVPPFSWKYFLASILAGSSAAIFLNVDVILAKHYLEPAAAGQYAILSLVGKLVFFSTSLLSPFIVSIVRRDEGRLIHPSRNFYLLLGGSAILALGSYLVFSVWGWFFIPLMLSAKSIAILPFANKYIIATLSYGLAGFISGYHITRNEYFFSKVGLIFALAMVGAIILVHDGIAQIVEMFFAVSLAYLVAVVILHALSWLREDLKKFRKSSEENLDTTLSVSIGIPGYNEGKNIGNLLEALLNQETKNIIINKIVVISSGSTDNTEAVVNDYIQKDSRISLIIEAKRLGKASAINQFLKVVADPVVVIESADTIPKPDTIEKLCLPFLRDEKIGMTGGSPVPVNDSNTFIGYIVHSWWWFHRNIPRFGEIVAFRNVLDQISPTTAVDEAFIQAKIVQEGYKARHVDDAVVMNKGSETIRDLIKQRRRIFNGHARLMKEENIRITNMTRSSFYLLLFKYEMTKLRHVVWLLGGIVLEIWARILGFFDRYYFSHNPVVWEIADSTKDLTPEELLTINNAEDSHDNLS